MDTSGNEDVHVDTCCSIGVKTSTEPYGHVRYLKDQIVRQVPISFIKDFNRDRFDPSKKYLVFWSNNPDETPEQVLKTQDIPVVRADDESEASGYYEATISVIKDSLEELNVFLNSKRVSQKTLKCLKEGSFEQGRTAPLKDRVKPVAPALENLKKVKFAHNAMYIFDKMKSKVPRSASKPSTSGTRRRVDPGRNNSPSSTSSGPDSDLEKIDPSYSPAKYRLLEEENKILLAENRRIRALNLKLQEKLNKSEDDNAALIMQSHDPFCENFTTTAVQEDVQNFCEAVLEDCDASGDAREHGQSDIPEPLIKKRKKVIETVTPAVEPPNNSTKGTVSPLPLFTPDELVIKKKPVNVLTPTLPLPASFDNFTTPFVSPPTTPIDVSSPSQSFVLSPPKCETLVSPDVKSLSYSDTVSPPYSDTVSPPSDLQKSQCKSGKKKPKNEQLTGITRELAFAIFGKEEPFEVVPGRITLNADTMKSLWEVVAGKTGDSMFVKKAAVALFGTSTLATHSVKGIKRPGDANPKPPLDPEVLFGIKRLMEIRILREGEQVQGNIRCKQSTINVYIQQKMKTL